jgi:hypothetical protein
MKYILKNILFFLWVWLKLPPEFLLVIEPYAILWVSMQPICETKSHACLMRGLAGQAAIDSHDCIHDST